ncbi:MAG: co-chaperone GroES [Nitrospirae bacterium]|nr:co-chaperone GroES [Nitrospirota bacterium]MBF0540041.1 co-chaperone GroES [Nitrospirota bacterium]
MDTWETGQSEESGEELIIVGARVLISLEDGGKKTKGGLYLPPTVVEKEDVASGLIIKIGPGYQMSDTAFNEEPWSERRPTMYFPMQAKIGDYAIFLRREAIEIEYQNKQYQIVPHSAILALIRPPDKTYLSFP